MRNSLKVILALFFFAFTASTGRAEDVLITQGSLMTSSSTGGPFSLTGNNINLTGGVNYANQSCNPCRPGQVLNFGSYNTGLDIRSGSGTVNGTSYSTLFYDGSLRFSGSIIIPSVNESLLTLIAPFTFTGTLSGCSQSTISGCPGGYLFSTSLVGRGLATINLNGFDSGLGNYLYSVRNVSYQFTAGEPVPEPATLALLGTGIAGIVAARRRRKKQDSGL